MALGFEDLIASMVDVPHGYNPGDLAKSPGLMSEENLGKVIRMLVEQEQNGQGGGEEIPPGEAGLPDIQPQTFDESMSGGISQGSPQEIAAATSPVVAAVRQKMAETSAPTESPRPLATESAPQQDVAESLLGKQLINALIQKRGLSEQEKTQRSEADQPISTSPDISTALVRALASGLGVGVGALVGGGRGAGGAAAVGLKSYDDWNKDDRSIARAKQIAREARLKATQGQLKDVDASILTLEQKIADIEQKGKDRVSREDIAQLNRATDEAISNAGITSRENEGVKNRENAFNLAASANASREREGGLDRENKLEEIRLQSTLKVKNRDEMLLKAVMAPRATIQELQKDGMSAEDALTRIGNWQEEYKAEEGRKQRELDLRERTVASQEQTNATTAFKNLTTIGQTEKRLDQTGQEVDIKKQTLGVRQEQNAWEREFKEKQQTALDGYRQITASIKKEGLTAANQLGWAKLAEAGRHNQLSEETTAAKVQADMAYKKATYELAKEKYGTMLSESQLKQETQKAQWMAQFDFDKQKQATQEKQFGEKQSTQKGQFATRQDWAEKKFATSMEESRQSALRKIEQQKNADPVVKRDIVKFLSAQQDVLSELKKLEESAVVLGISDSWRLTKQIKGAADYLPGVQTNNAIYNSQASILAQKLVKMLQDGRVSNFDIEYSQEQMTPQATDSVDMINSKISNLRMTVARSLQAKLHGARLSGFDVSGFEQDSKLRKILGPDWIDSKNNISQLPLFQKWVDPNTGEAKSLKLQADGKYYPQ